jgi:hypothetical protein
MHGILELNDRRASRRRVLVLAASAAALGGVGWTGLAFAADAPKATQKSVSYQNHPKAGKGCNTCKAFQPPSKCKTVEGPVEAGGWCDKYVKN